MNATRCPKCKLINGDGTGICRRCGNSLSPHTAANASDSRRPNFTQAARRLAIPLIAIISVLCIFGFTRYSKIDVASRTKPARDANATAKNESANREFEEVRNLNRDFIARLDTNLADRNGDGFIKNQALAGNTLALLKNQQDKITDSTAQKYLDEFTRLVEKYSSQLVQYNSDTAHLADVSQRIKDEKDEIQQDESLPPEEKLAKQRNLKGKFYEETQNCSVTSSDLNETAKYLHDLAVMDADGINKPRVEYIKPPSWPQPQSAMSN
jgi:hypothetical protein